MVPLTLYDDDADSSATIVPGFRRRVGRTRNVAVMTESTLPLPDQIAAIKIDVEGGELWVIEGLMQTIRRARPHIVVEILPSKGSSGRLERQERLQALLFDCGYRVFSVRGGITEIPSIAADRSKNDVDFVFSPR